MAFTATWARLAGQDVNWDLRNYHTYVVDAWLHGQTFWHLAPGQTQSWLNPLPHLVQFLLISVTPPVVAGTAMGALAGINGWLVWLLARRLQGWSEERGSRLVALAATVLALTGPMFLSMVGASWAEWVCSPFILMALLPLVPGERATGLALHPRALLLSGLVMGFACGLKLTGLVYAIGLTAALIVVAPGAVPSRSALAYAASGLGGFLISGGVWALRLQEVFGSPIFPYFNAIFDSPLAVPTNWSDPRFLPASVPVAALTYPFEWLAGGHPTNELAFRDARFAVAALLVPVAAVMMWLRRHAEARGHGAETSQRFWLIMVFVVVSYVVWLQFFGIQRFALPLELVMGIVIALSIEVMLGRGRAATAAVLVVTAMIVPWTRVPNWGRVAYGPDWFQVSAPVSDVPVLHVLVGHEPMAYVIQFMPRHDRFVRVDGNMPLGPERYLGREARRLIREHGGPIRTLSGGPLLDADRAALAAFGLAVVAPARCEVITTLIHPLRSCVAERLDAPP